MIGLAVDVFRQNRYFRYFITVNTQVFKFHLESCIRLRNTLSLEILLITHGSKATNKSTSLFVWGFFYMFLSVLLGGGYFCLGVFLAIFSHLREVSVVVTGTGNLCNNRKIKLCIHLLFPFEDNYYLDQMYSIYTYQDVFKHFSIK